MSSDKSNKSILGLIKATFKDWTEDKASRLGAALAYYAIFSIGPILVVTIAIAGWVFGDAASQGQVTSALRGVLGEDSAKLIEGMLKSANSTGSGIIAGVIGLVTLLLGAMGIFGQLKDALNTIWEVKPASSGIMGAIKKNGLSFLMVLGVGLLLLASMVINTLLSALGPFISQNIPGGALLWNIVNYAVTLALIAVVFAAMFKILPNVQFAWKDALIGGAVTSGLFLIGQFALGLYFGIAPPGSAFGAAASLVIVLVWIYYSAQILFLGAEFTQVYANQYGAGVEPEAGAHFVTEDARAQQGATGSKTARNKQRREEASRRDGASLRTSPWFR